MSAELKEKVEARRSPTRCPYCHDDCAPDGSVACQDCLARHHTACWSETGRCGACASERRLEAAPAPALTLARVEALVVQAGYRAEELHRLLRAPAARRAAAWLRRGVAAVALTTILATVAHFVLRTVPGGSTQLTLFTVVVTGLASGLLTPLVGPRAGFVASLLVVAAGLLGGLVNAHTGGGPLLLWVLVGTITSGLAAVTLGPAPAPSPASARSAEGLLHPAPQAPVGEGTSR